ncbi:MAG: baeRF10 domain-containing protein [Acidimicrobiales bacterium]
MAYDAGSARAAGQSVGSRRHGVRSQREVSVRVPSRQEVRDLARFEGGGAPVVSLYLDVDGRKYTRSEGYMSHLASLLSRARERGGAEAADLEQVEGWFRGGIGVERKGVRGVALFSCTKRDMLQAFQLPVPVADEVVVNDRPNVRQLERVLERAVRFGVLLADRQRARMMVAQLGNIVYTEEIFDELPRHDDEPGRMDRSPAPTKPVSVAQHHLKRAAKLAFTVQKDHAYDALLIGADTSVVGELERELHPYCSGSHCERIGASLSSSVLEVKRAIADAEDRWDALRRDEQMAKVRAGLSSGKAVAGIAPVLDALSSKRLSLLMISADYTAPGWRCGACGALAAKGRACPVCGQEMVRLDDIVSEALDMALGLSCEVLTCTANADLDVAGRIAGLLRF